MSESCRVFLLSPASLGGVRGRRILSGQGDAPLVTALHEGGTVPLGDVYAFISSLYYRGKRAYAEAFAHRPGGGPAVYAITPGRGLVPDPHPVDLTVLEGFAGIDVDPGEEAYVGPLRKTAEGLLHTLPDDATLVLLGSLATPKYLGPLGDVLGPRLIAPRIFAGMGDMQRGSALLRAVRDGVELDYVEARTLSGKSSAMAWGS